ncbi:unnamed protein product [Ectocarpus sp. CCAP 1310/34]|nr:unnamed protein product [Ectocarpus sp. CCAP 1310/34]
MHHLFPDSNDLRRGLHRDYYVVGDSAYGATDKMLAPYPGCDLNADQDAFNFFQSQGRICIEQTFGIMATLVAENGKDLIQRASQQRYDSVVQRGDVAALSRSRDVAHAAAAKARESKNKAMAAKRSAEKAAEEAKKVAEEQQRLGDLATAAAEAERASRVRAEEEKRAAAEKLEEERRRVQLLTEQIARLALEKKEQDRLQ